MLNMFFFFNLNLLHITDFEILAFPCNQFGGQEPGSNEEIVEFACTRFKAEYPIFDKVMLLRSFVITSKLLLQVK